MKAVAAIAIVGASLLVGSAGPDVAREKPSRPELLAQLVATANAPAGVLRVAVGDTVWRGTTRARGWKQRSAIGVGSGVRIASVTKTFLAVVVLQLVAERALSLDDAAQDALPPGFRAGRITIRELLNHTSGLSDAGVLEPVPGAFRYDNANYRVLGEIVERITGRPAEQAIRERVLEPLGLRQTHWPKRARPAGLARGYSPAGADVTALAPARLTSADALVSTADDLGRFLAGLLGGAVVPRKQLVAMETAVQAGRAYRGLDERYGLGLMGFDTPCGPVWGHRGRTVGYTTFAFATPDGSRSAVALLNVGRVDDAKVPQLNALVFAALCS